MSFDCQHWFELNVCGTHVLLIDFCQLFCMNTLNQQWLSVNELYSRTQISFRLPKELEPN